MKETSEVRPFWRNVGIVAGSFGLALGSAFIVESTVGSSASHAPEHAVQNASEVSIDCAPKTGESPVQMPTVDSSGPIATPPSSRWCAIPHLTQLPAGYALSRRALLSYSPGEVIYWTQYVDMSGAANTIRGALGAPQIDVFIETGGPATSPAVAPSSRRSSSYEASLRDGSIAMVTPASTNNQGTTVIQWIPTKHQGQTDGSNRGSDTVTTINVNGKNVTTSLLEAAANNVSVS